MDKGALEALIEVLLAEPMQKPASASEDDVIAYLTGTCMYKDVQVISATHWVAICPFIFTHAIIIGTIDEASFGYSDRWCYHSYEEAKAALDAWDESAYSGEPRGWHRHPDSGRRRDENGKEYIQR